MATTEDENPTKRPRISQDEEEVIDLEESEDGNLPQDIELENQLREAQADLDKIHEEMLSRLREVEQEFELKKAPFYKVRGEVIKNIPGFWLHCFLQHQEIKHIIGDIDEQILSSLIEIAIEPQQESRDGYKLSFRFADNSWFEATVLAKQIHFVTDSDTGAQTCSTTGSKPKWKTQDPTAGYDEGKGAEAAPFLTWLVSERAFEPGHVDTLADIIKDQLFVNPLEYLEAENASEIQEGDELLEGEQDADVSKGAAFDDELGEDSGDEGNDIEPYDLEEDENAQIAGDGGEEAEEGDIDQGEAEEELEDLLETGEAGEGDEGAGEEEDPALDDEG